VTPSWLMLRANVSDWIKRRGKPEPEPIAEASPAE
jgi:hypothetical protein